MSSKQTAPGFLFMLLPLFINPSYPSPITDKKNEAQNLYHISVQYLTPMDEGARQSFVNLNDVL